MTCPRITLLTGMPTQVDLGVKRELGGGGRCLELLRSMVVLGLLKIGTGLVLLKSGPPLRLLRSGTALVLLSVAGLGLWRGRAETGL